MRGVQMQPDLLHIDEKGMQAPQATGQKGCVCACEGVGEAFQNSRSALQPWSDLSHAIPTVSTNGPAEHQLANATGDGADKGCLTDA